MNMEFKGELNKLDNSTKVDSRNVYEGINYGVVLDAYLDAYTDNNLIRVNTNTRLDNLVLSSLE